MNASGCGCLAQVGPRDFRAELWMKIRGDRVWPLLGPLPVSDGSRNFLRGRLNDLDHEQREVLNRWMNVRFRTPILTVDRELGAIGFVPIQQVDVQVLRCRDHAYVALVPAPSPTGLGAREVAP